MSRTGPPLVGKVALVTGATQGIGRAVASRLAADGATIAVTHPPDASPEQTLTAIAQTGGRAFAAPADVACASEVNSMIEAVVDYAEGIDILVNNAGICPLVDFFDLTEATWDRTHAVNLKGTFLCSQAVARQLVLQGRGGRIIAVSSISAIVGGSLQAHYCPTKAGVRALMNALAIVLGPHGITCNSVLPGTIRTPLNEAFLADPAIHDHYAGRIPVGRLGHPGDVAGAIAFLASQDAGYISGADLLVDGGALVNLA